MHSTNVILHFNIPRCCSFVAAMSMSIPAVTRSLRSRFLTALEIPPTFLAPSLQYVSTPKLQTSQFSTSTTRCLRTRDYSKNRGVSGLRRTGLKRPTEMAKEPLPQPVLDPAKRSKIKVDENHGLWGFFNKEKRSLTKPEDENAHGLSFLHYVVKRKGADERFP